MDYYISFIIQQFDWLKPGHVEVNSFRLLYLFPTLRVNSSFCDVTGDVISDVLDVIESCVGKYSKYQNMAKKTRNRETAVELYENGKSFGEAIE